MGTRLLSESLVRARFPHLRYIRIHTSSRHAATIYAWNDQLQLPDADQADLRRFAADYLVPYVCFKIKAYSMIQEEEVPPAGALPECVERAAMSRSLDLPGIIGVLNGMFAEGEIVFERYDQAAGMVYLSVHTQAVVTEIERELLRRYLYELLPLGTNFEVAYDLVLNE
ncbi:hypothetical protein [Cohnella nanjingensis]|uniref:Uncharacterized protein n=1 Tax=Cohnella nanjingensis TaxID=1387779 RepID=A0A7X0RPE4_9BACL|nr:hypothetical protein [Cohnella nanjingensis]MBB6671219.1 hypothetical protein [Cohnella nanjingensis]